MSFGLLQRWSFWHALVAAIMLAAGVTGGGARAAPLRTAFLPFTLEDTSRPDPGAQPDPADVARLREVQEMVQRLLVRSGDYVAVDTRPIAHAIADNDLVGCNGCAVSLGREVGAQVVVTGWVQKISTLIINMTVMVRSVRSGQMIVAGNASLRGDTDLSWTRATDWLVTHRLLRHGTVP